MVKEKRNMELETRRDTEIYTSIQENFVIFW